MHGHLYFYVCMVVVYGIERIYGVTVTSIQEGVGFQGVVRRVDTCLRNLGNQQSPQVQMKHVVEANNYPVRALP